VKFILLIEFSISWEYAEKVIDAIGVLVKFYKNDFLKFKLIPLVGGIFEVKFEERLMFSKKLGRFPQLDELIELIKNIFLLI